MKQARLVLASLALVAAVTWVTGAFACDEQKNTTASAKSAAYTAVTASQGSKTCTAEEMAACRAKKARVSAVTASSAGAYDHCAAKNAKATAVTAVAGGAYDHCASKGAKASAVTAAAAGSADHCAGKRANKSSNATAVTASTAGSSSTCGSKSRAYAAGSGGYCNGQGMAKSAGKTAHSHADCEACADMALCSDELDVAGAHTQVVPLRNGVMFVYTADTPNAVSAVQSAMVRRSERMTQFVTAGDRARLCDECKAMRGAMASGKLSREVVNIEGGSLTLMTSDDPKTVAKIHAMIDGRTGLRKS